jgi:hypothetical protein
LPRGSEKSNEFKRYRQVLAALYLGTVAVGFLLLAISVVKELYFRPTVALRGPVLSADNPDPAHLQRCNADVAELLDSLAQRAADLISRAPQGDDSEIMPTWEAFSRQWLRRWDEIDASCRFSKLGDGPMGEAYDRMAKVHSDLRAMRLKYQSLLAQFDREQRDDLASMRRALERSRRALGPAPAPPELRESAP